MESISHTHVICMVLSHDNSKPLFPFKTLPWIEAYEVLSDDEKRARFDNGEDIEVSDRI
jgi:hypothetical protein